LEDMANTPIHIHQAGTTLSRLTDKDLIEM
jgi:hypothetical protein